MLNESMDKERQRLVLNQMDLRQSKLLLENSNKKRSEACITHASNDLRLATGLLTWTHHNYSDAGLFQGQYEDSVKEKTSHWNAFVKPMGH